MEALSEKVATQSSGRGLILSSGLGGASRQREEQERSAQMNEVSEEGKLS